MQEQDMIVFFVEEAIGSGRMGGEEAYCIGHDGKKSYIAINKNLPKTYDNMLNFLKSGKLIFFPNENTEFLFQHVMEFSNNKDKTLFDFKLDEPAYLGAGNFSTCLCVLMVNISH